MSDAPAVTPAAAQEKIADEVPGFKVFVGNLPYGTTEEGLKTFFASVASDITSSQIILRGTRSAGYAFLAFETEAAANKAVQEFNQKELDGRAVQVELAKPPGDKPKRVKKPKSRRGDGKAPPGEVTEAEANGETPADGGAAGDETAKPKKKKKARKPKKKTADGEVVPKSEGETPADGEATEAKKPRVKKPRAPRPPRRAPGEDPSGDPSKNMLFVANLGFSTDDAGLTALFKDVGIEVKSAHVVRRRWGNPRRSKGYGFVDVGDEATQKKSVELLNGKEVNGRPIAVKIAIDAVVKQEQADEADAAGSAPEATVVAA